MKKKLYKAIDQIFAGHDDCIEKKEILFLINQLPDLEELEERVVDVLQYSSPIRQLSLDRDIEKIRAEFRAAGEKPTTERRITSIDQLKPGMVVERVYGDGSIDEQEILHVGSKKYFCRYKHRLDGEIKEKSYYLDSNLTNVSYLRVKEG